MKNVLFLLLFSTVSLAGQTPVDSALVARQIDSLIQVSSNFLDQGDSDKALIAITDADTLAIGRFGRVSTLYADCCLGRGLVHENKRERTVAETWYKKALSIYEASLQKKHPGYIQSLYTLGLFYAYGGELDKAKPFFIEAVSICSKEVTKSNPEYAKSLVNLGTFYAMSGDFIESERLFSEGKSIF